MASSINDILDDEYFSIFKQLHPEYFDFLKEEMLAAYEGCKAIIQQMAGTGSLSEQPEKDAKHMFIVSLMNKASKKKIDFK